MKKIILIIENHSHLRKTVKSLIKKSISGFVIKEANNARMGIGKAVREKPNIVVLDITLPDMNGLEAAKKIKNEIPKVKIILLTMCAKHEICQCDTIGITTSIKKNEIFEKLVPAVKQLLMKGKNDDTEIRIL